MKKGKFYLRGAQAMLIGLLLANQSVVQAQTLQLPTRPDNMWYNLPHLTWALNTAEIAYGGGTLFCSMATSSAGGGPIGNHTIFVNDYNSSASIGFILPGLTQVGANDIILGNSDGTGGRSSTADFILAACFVNMAGDPEVDFYDVNVTPLISVTPISTYVISAGTYRPSTVHMDVIANYDPSTYIYTGLPFCGKFMITWDDGNTGNVFVAEGDLNTQTVGIPQFVGPGYAPDVAGINRFATVDDVALVTYNSGTSSILLTGWNATAGTFAPTLTLDNGSTSYSLGRPRIDAFDDYHVNMTPGTSHYKVVASALNFFTPSNFEVRTYDNLLYPGNYAISNMNNLTPGGYAAPFYHGMAPCVSVWGTTGYAVQQVDEAVSGGWGGRQVLVAQPVDYMNPTALWASTYYWVNSLGGFPYNAAGADFFNSVSCTPNLLSKNSPELFAWADNMGGIWSIKYKMTYYPPSFKPGSTTSMTGTPQVKLYPNPATDYLNIKMNGANDVNGYNIVDILGHTVLQGSGNLQHINIGAIASGNYFIKLLNGDKATTTLPFVKQ